MLSENASQYQFNLANQPWREVAPGLREKSHPLGAKRFRLVEFSASFEEPDWCLKQHAGFVLSGEIVVDVNGQRISYRQGDVLNLPSGVRHRHLATIETATLLLIEDTPAVRSENK